MTQNKGIHCGAAASYSRRRINHENLIKSSLQPEYVIDLCSNKRIINKILIRIHDKIQPKIHEIDFNADTLFCIPHFKTLKSILCTTLIIELQKLMHENVVLHSLALSSKRYFLLDDASQPRLGILLC